MVDSRLAHIVNPVVVDQTSDLYIAQPISFESMRRAADSAAPGLDVELYVTQFVDEQAILPRGFGQAPLLQRSVLDVANFSYPRRLPLLADILDSLYLVGDAPYLIYTNVDIGLQPNFYSTVVNFIEMGYDAFVINRRTIPAIYHSVEQLDLIYSDPGQAHAGWDCFVFPRQLVPRFKLYEVCIGASRVGLALLANMVAYADNFRDFRDEHLTFHIGDARNWLRPEYADYDAHNTRLLLRILDEIQEEQGAFSPDSIPGSFLLRRRLMGPLYDIWARKVYLPPSISRLLNRLAGRN